MTIHNENPIFYDEFNQFHFKIEYKNDPVWII